MKLLFICDRIDLDLKHRLDQLELYDIEAHCLVLPKFTLYKNWEKEVIQTKEPINFLDIGGRFQTFSKNLRYKKLFDSMDRYDSVNIYKCISTCAPFTNNIRKIAKSYFITIGDEHINKNRQTLKIFDHSFCILFNNQQNLTDFERNFGYDEKTLIVRDGNHLISIVDTLKPKEIEKFQKYLNLDLQKNIVYCDLGSDLNIQIAFIKDLFKLPFEQLKQTTFIFDPSTSTLIDKERLIEYLTDKRFDYLIPDSLLTHEQKAMLLTISGNTVILPGSEDYNTLQPSLYTKSHIYRYDDQTKNSFYKEHNIFIDTFENFENALTFNSGSLGLIGELLKANKEVTTKLFHPDVSIKNYIEVLKIL